MYLHVDLRLYLSYLSSILHRTRKRCTTDSWTNSPGDSGTWDSEELMLLVTSLSTSTPTSRPNHIVYLTCDLSIFSCLSGRHSQLARLANIRRSYCLYWRERECKKAYRSWIAVRYIIEMLYFLIWSMVWLNWCCILNLKLFQSSYLQRPEASLLPVNKPNLYGYTNILQKGRHDA